MYFPNKEKNEHEEKQIKKIPQAQELYNALGPDHWKVYIDAIHQGKGQPTRKKYVYDEGTHEGAKEPGFHKSMTTANNFVSETLGMPLNKEFYIEIHKLAFAHNIKKSGIRRTEAVSVDLQIKNQDEGVFTEADCYLYFEKDDGKGNYKVYQKIIGQNKISGKFKEIIAAYYKRIKSLNHDEEKLEVIAETHLHLEWLHMFEDGNARLNKLILNKLLAENGLPLCILDTPLGAEHTSLSKWITKIKQGQLLWTTETEKVTPEKRALYLEKKIKRRNESTAAEKIATKFNETEMLKKIEEQAAQEKLLKYEESDTSSDEENSSRVKKEKINARDFNRISKILENGDIEGALKELDSFDFADIDADEFVFNTMMDFGKKNNNKEIITNLIKHFIETRKVNASKYTRGKYHLWVVKSIYELYLINKNDRALKLCEKHLKLILENSESKYRDEAELFLMKIKKDKS